LKRFEGNEEMFLGIVSSYFSQIPSMLEKVQACTEETLKGDYKIAVHSLKSTSYTVGAKSIGSMAEELEKAAASGDMEFIQSHNDALVAALKKLMLSIGNLLEETRSANQKPLRPAPDPSLLAAILKACSNYDMELLDKTMAELEQYRYEARVDLIEWLRKEIDKSELESIKERLESLNIISGGK
jgi:HPt (histidine-containing phosphotransfer) domain-containing protein